MKYLSLVLLISVTISCNNSKRGSGNIIKETRQVKAFDGIMASGAVNVDVQTGATASVIVETDDNIMTFVETNVSGGTLNIKLNSINNLRNSTVYVHVVTSEIKSLSSSASAEIVSNNILATKEKFVIKASSGSSIHVNIDAASVNVEASSGAEIEGKGKIRELVGNSSSGSSINFLELYAETAKATVSSGASIKLFASISIDANASSGGEIKYTGGAKAVQKNVSSGGSVNAQ